MYSQQNTELIALLYVLLNRLDNKDRKLGKLETIQSTMDTLTAKCECMDKKVSQIESKILGIEQSRQFDSNMLHN